MAMPTCLFLASTKISGTKVVAIAEVVGDSITLNGAVAAVRSTISDCTRGGTSIAFANGCDYYTSTAAVFATPRGLVDGIPKAEATFQATRAFHATKARKNATTTATKATTITAKAITEGIIVTTKTIVASEVIVTSEVIIASEVIVASEAIVAKGAVARVGGAVAAPIIGTTSASRVFAISSAETVAKAYCLARPVAT